MFLKKSKRKEIKSLAALPGRIGIKQRRAIANCEADPAMHH
jgi:hypothetical protein